MTEKYKKTTAERSEQIHSGYSYNSNKASKEVTLEKIAQRNYSSKKETGELGLKKLNCEKKSSRISGFLT